MKSVSSCGNVVCRGGPFRRFGTIISSGSGIHNRSTTIFITLWLFVCSALFAIFWVSIKLLRDALNSLNVTCLKVTLKVSFCVTTVKNGWNSVVGNPFSVIAINRLSLTNTRQFYFTCQCRKSGQESIKYYLVNPFLTDVPF